MEILSQKKNEEIKSFENKIKTFEDKFIDVSRYVKENCKDSNFIKSYLKFFVNQNGI